MTDALRPLRDVGGVLGSFVVDDQGFVIAADVPELIDAEALDAAGSRLAQVCDALSYGGPLSDCALRFGEHTLFLHRFTDRTLCVIAPQRTNLAALRMGSRLAARRLSRAPTAPAAGPAPGTGGDAEPPAAAPVAPRQPLRRGGGAFPGRQAAASTPHAAAESDAPRPRFFRGRRIE